MEEAPKPSAAGEFWRSLFVNPAPKAPWPSAIRRGFIVAAIVGVAVLTDHFAQGAVAAIGALNLGMVDGAVPRRTLAKALILSSVLVAIIAGLSSFVAFSWWAVPLLGIIAFVQGTISAAGMVALNAGLMTLITAVVFSNDAGNAASSFQFALLVLLGAAIQSASSLIAWRAERDAAVRRSIAVAVSELRAFVLDATRVSDLHLASAAAEADAERTLIGAGLPKPRFDVFAEILAELNWTRLCVSDWLLAGNPTADQRQALAPALNAIAEAISKHAHPGRNALPDQLDPAGGPHWTLVSEQVVKLETAVAVYANAAAAPAKNDPVPVSAGNADADLSVAARADRAWTSRERFSAVTKLFSPRLPMFRHGLRIAVAVAGAEALVLVLHIDRGYWVVLTVVMVLKPDFATTLTRGALRIAGTIVGVVVLGVLLALPIHSPWFAVILLFILAPLVMRFITGNYGLASAAVTMTVLVLVEAASQSYGTIEERLVNTLIGAAIALVAMLLWPKWRGDDLPALLTRTLRAHQVWFTALLAGYTHPAAADLAEIRRMGLAARDTILEAQPSAEGAVIEPHSASANPAAALHVLEFCQHAALAALALEVDLREQRAPFPRADQVNAIVSADFSDAIASAGGNTRQPSAATHPAARADRPAGTGDLVSDRALTQLIAAADSTAAAAATL